MRYCDEGKVHGNAALYGEFDEIVRSVGTVESGEVV
jgi:hypothetical protein